MFQETPITGPRSTKEDHRDSENPFSSLAAIAARGSTALGTAKQVLAAQSEALQLTAERLDNHFTRALELILGCQGKVIVTGLGKSGHIARRLAATLCSTGTRAVYLHASDATHGDLGVYSSGDPTILLSKSGAPTNLSA